MDNFLFLPRAAAGALYDLLFAAITGILLGALWLREAPTTLRRQLRLTLIAASTILLLTLAVQLWLTTATMLGATDPHQLLPALHDVLTSTHAGRTTGLAAIPALALLILACFPSDRPPLRARLLSEQPALRACLIPLLILVILRSATGHAAANGDLNLDEALQLIHLAATAVWAGAILAAGLLIAPQLQTDPATLTALGNRVSRYATVSIALVIATGILKSWRALGGTLPPLIHTQWGILLTLKGTLVALALLLGLYNRLLLGRNPTLTPPNAQRFTRGLRLEALLMIAILTLSSFLANSPPATGP